MSEITTVGLDLAKRGVSLCGEDASGGWWRNARYAGRRCSHGSCSGRRA
jgi:hypothetical protein